MTDGRRRHPSLDTPGSHVVVPHFIDEGDPSSDHALLALHSLGADHHLWHDQVPAFLGHRRRVILMDSRGHGRSGWPGVASLPGWVQDIENVLDVTGVRTVDLVGISMGGVQALAFASASPARVRALVLSNTFGELDRETAARKTALLSGQARSLGMGKFAARYVEDTLISAGTQASSQLCTAIAAVPLEAYIASATACFGAQLDTALPSIAMPALVLWGALDQKTPRPLSQRLVERLPDARLEVIHGAGHLANLDQPAAFAAAVGRFLEIS